MLRPITALDKPLQSPWYTHTTRRQQLHQNAIPLGSGVKGPIGRSFLKALTGVLGREGIRVATGVIGLEGALTLTRSGTLN